MRLRMVLLLGALVLFALFGCTDVKAFQKGNLAKSHMAFDTDPLESRFMQHVYTSKEGASGGYGLSGGGCGCN